MTSSSAPRSLLNSNKPLDPTESILAWQADSSPDNANRMLKEVDPIIQSAVRTHTGGMSPTALGYARVETLRALKSYDPSKGAQPKTFLHSQLQGLQRWQASRSNGVRIPVRAGHQRMLIEQAEAELEDKMGRPASTAELATKLNLTIDAIDKVRRFQSPIPGSRETSMNDDDEASTVEDQMLQPTNDKAWLEMVYGDLPEKDRVIMEHTLGMFGKPKLSNGALAKRMKLSMGAISQRKAKIQAYIDRAMQVNPF